MATGPESEAFARTLRFMRGTAELVADRVLPIAEGYVLRAPSLPDVWYLNDVHITAPVSTARAVELADEHLADLSYRQLHVEDQKTGWKLERSLRVEGWRMEREVVMVLQRPADREVDTRAVIEASEDQMVELMDRWHMEGPDTTPAAMAQLSENARRETRARGDRNFGIADGGALLAITKLRSDGVIAQVEDVFTAPEARERGYARVLVSHAVAQAQARGHELVFIVADDKDWPKHLYRRIGFEPVGHTWAFHRKARGR